MHFFVSSGYRKKINKNNVLENKKKSKILYFFEKRALLKSDKIIAVSEFSGLKTKQIL